MSSDTQSADGRPPANRHDMLSLYSYRPSQEKIDNVLGINRAAVPAAASNKQPAVLWHNPAGG